MPAAAASRQTLNPHTILLEQQRTRFQDIFQAQQQAAWEVLKDLQVKQAEELILAIRGPAIALTDQEKVPAVLAAPVGPQAAALLIQVDPKHTRLAPCKPCKPTADEVEVKADEADEFTPCGPTADEADEIAPCEPHSHPAFARSKSKSSALYDEIMRETTKARFTSERSVQLCGPARCQDLIDKVAKSYLFEIFVNVVIFVNTVALGVETQQSLEGIMWSPYIEIPFLSVYMFELAVRLLQTGSKKCMDPWITFDVVLVTIGTLSILFELILASNDATKFMSQIMVFRVWRLLRLIRFLRMLRQFRIMWRLIFGLLSSLNTMLSTLVLIVVALYVFALIGVEIITKDELLASHPDTEYIVHYYFGSVARTMLTLSHFVSGDSMGGFYFPMIMLRPGLLLYFTAVVLVVTIALMNLVTAVLVEGALQQAQEDKDFASHEMKSRIKAALPEIVKAFEDIDKDGSGSVTKEEIEDVDLHDILPPEVLTGSEINTVAELFDLLDVDGTGELSRAEFVEGLLEILMLDTPIATMQTLRLLKLSREKLSSMSDDIAEMKAGCVNGCRL
ncbi:unnamed protein product [Polarella glacialis]|uniref:EF-hand domain-containing protein n=1 Tax=Polarella glacialis TaxID=89957 RepID=A0A813JI48_POLGL|nr:unnamed protein product [Polarella glacialis]